MIELLFGKTDAQQCLVLVDLLGGHGVPLLDRSRSWQLLLSSNEKRFGGDESAAFAQPEVRVFQSVQRDSLGEIRQTRLTMCFDSIDPVALSARMNADLRR